MPAATPCVYYYFDAAVAAAALRQRRCFPDVMLIYAIAACRVAAFAFAADTPTAIFCCRRFASLR